METLGHSITSVPYKWGQSPQRRYACSCKCYCAHHVIQAPVRPLCGKEWLLLEIPPALLLLVCEQRRSLVHDDFPSHEELIGALDVSTQVALNRTMSSCEIPEVIGNI